MLSVGRQSNVRWTSVGRPSNVDPLDVRQLDVPSDVRRTCVGRQLDVRRTSDGGRHVRQTSVLEHPHQ